MAGLIERIGWRERVSKVVRGARLRVEPAVMGLGAGMRTFAERETKDAREKLQERASEAATSLAVRLAESPRVRELAAATTTRAIEAGVAFAQTPKGQEATKQLIGAVTRSATDHLASHPELATRATREVVRGAQSALENPETRDQLREAARTVVTVAASEVKKRPELVGSVASLGREVLGDPTTREALVGAGKTAVAMARDELAKPETRTAVVGAVSELTDRVVIASREVLQRPEVQETLERAGQTAAARIKEELRTRRAQEAIMEGARAFGRGVVSKVNVPDVVEMAARITNPNPNRSIFTRMRSMFKETADDPLILGFFHTVAAGALTAYCWIDGTIKAFSYSLSKRDFSEFWKTQKAFSELTANSIQLPTLIHSPSAVRPQI